MTFFRRILMAGLALVASGASAQLPQWGQMTGTPAGTSPRHDDIHFVSPKHGWAARATDGIWRTTNGGLDFTRVRASSFAYPGTNLTAHFRSIGFASATRGWAGNLGPGSYDASVTDTNLLLETFDGGLSWTPVAAVNQSDMKGFCAIQVLDAQHIYGAGRVRGPAHFARSTDGGITWSVTNLTAAGLMGGIMDVFFHDAQHGFLVGMDTNAYTTSCSGYRGTIARTTDGGATWTNVVTVPITCSYFWKMSWPTPQVGYVTLQQNGSYDDVVFYKTTDGGVTWSSNGIPLAAIGAGSFFLQSVGFVSELEGWMGGSPTVAAPFNFIHTTDGGLTWAPVGYNNTQSINRIRFLTPEFGYASGRTLHWYRMPLVITRQPTNQFVFAGQTVSFTVAATGVPPLTYQWRREGQPVAFATNAELTLTSVQTPNAGNYDVVVADSFTSVTSVVARLSLPFREDFDADATPVSVTGVGTNSGYRFRFSAASGPVDFRAVLGFDYSTITKPTPIGAAPATTNGSTRGLFLSVNKDATAAVAAVNVYPEFGYAEGNFALKFDLWLNWSNTATSTEHAWFGINHSGTFTNRPGVPGSDGLIFGIAADAGVAATSTTLRDYAIFRGGGAGAAPVLLLTNNTTFGPSPLLGPQFDGANPGLAGLFPVKNLPAFPATPLGSAGLGWVSVEVRQVNQLITYLLNGVAVAQFTNLTAYTNGTIMLGYYDGFSSIGDTNGFALFDNVRVEPVVLVPAVLSAARREGNAFAFEFATQQYATYTVQRATNLLAPQWEWVTNVVGQGPVTSVTLPGPVPTQPAQYFRVVQP